METIQEGINDHDWIPYLFNTGGPRSRVRSEKISSSIFESENLMTQNEVYSLTIPQHVTDIEKWVIALYGSNHFINWDHVLRELKLPTVRMLVVPSDNFYLMHSVAKKEMFRRAVILSKCSSNFYSPDSPMIFTRNRLNRTVELIKINLNGYYEMV